MKKKKKKQYMAIQGFKVRSQTLIDKDESGNGQQEETATQWIRRRGLMTRDTPCSPWLCSSDRNKSWIPATFVLQAEERICLPWRGGLKVLYSLLTPIKVTKIT